MTFSYTINVGVISKSSFLSYYNNTESIDFSGFSENLLKKLFKFELTGGN